MIDQATRSHIEAWVYDLADRVQRRDRVEDDVRVELKRDWPEPQVAARRLAGHANAARREPILWVIGMDEDTGPTKPGASWDPATWWSQVSREFDGQPPGLTAVSVPIEAVTLTALHFTTLQPPYVVKNPKGGAITHEVPWREGTAIRTARHEHLIRMLAPVVAKPEYEIRYASLAVEMRGDPFDNNMPRYHWTFAVGLYTTPAPGAQQVVIPTHRCRVLLAEPSSIRSPELSATTFRSEAPLASGGPSEAILNGPGLIQLEAWGRAAEPPRTDTDKVAVEILLAPARSEASQITVGLTGGTVGSLAPLQEGSLMGLWTRARGDERRVLQAKSLA